MHRRAIETFDTERTLSVQESEEDDRSTLKRPDDPPESAPVPRRAARVILRNLASQVLLIRYDVSGYVFWTTPGGAVEPNESDKAAATRELLEEVQIIAELAGPVHTAVGRFHHEGWYVENTDIFFTAIVEAATPGVHGVTKYEVEAMREARWWSLEDLKATTINVFPRDLATVVRRLQAADQ